MKLAMMSISSIVAVALAACGNKAADKPAAACGPVIEGAIDRMLADAKTNGMLSADKVAAVVELAPRMKDAITKVCTEDSWSPAALECLDTAKSQKEINQCEHKLTPAQKTRTDAVRKTVLSGVGRLTGSAAPVVPAVPTVPTSQP